MTGNEKKLAVDRNDECLGEERGERVERERGGWGADAEREEGGRPRRRRGPRSGGAARAPRHEFLTLAVTASRYVGGGRPRFVLSRRYSPRAPGNHAPR